MKIKTPYKPRSIHPIGLLEHDGWTIKVYSISIHQRVVSNELVGYAHARLSEWLKESANYPLPTYHVATLIIHEGQDGIYILLNWWIDENMLQNHMYFSTYAEPENFQLLSGKGMMACVWELAVLWHERNAWIEHVLKKNEQPDVVAYLKDYLDIHSEAPIL